MYVCINSTAWICCSSRSGTSHGCW